MQTIFCAELTDIKTIHNVLKAISFKEFATIRIMEEGLKITIEEMKSVQTSAYIPSNVFNRYEVNVEDNEPATFKISFKVLTECLNIFGEEGAPSLKLVYKSHGCPLSLVYVQLPRGNSLRHIFLTHSEENITVNSDILTMEADELAELSLADECTLNNIVVNANQFVSLLSEQDSTADVFELITSPESPYFKMSTVGTMGECHTEVSKNSDMIVIFRCNTVCSSQYKFSNIKQLMKVMHLANKISLSTGEQGLLGLQLIISIENDKQMYVEYYVNSLLETD